MPDDNLRAPIINMKSDEINAETRLYAVRALAIDLLRIMESAQLVNLPPSNPEDIYRKGALFAMLILTVTEKGA